MAELLLELLSEEIPARMQARAAEDLKRLVCDGLKDAGLTFDRAEAYVTPRRLTLVVAGLPTKTQDEKIERKGPSVGAPDKAIQGFLKSAGLSSLDECEIRDVKGKQVYFVVTEKKGQATAKILPELFNDVFEKIPWPKSMRWGANAQRWVRPVQGLLCVFEEVTVDDVVIGDDPAGNMTLGHRFLSSGPIEVKNFADYEKKLRAAHVMLGPAERRETILRDAEALAKKEKLTLKTDEGLLREVAGLVEWPVVLMGTIDQTYLDLPPEVLSTAMRQHQKYFSLLDTDGTLAPRFIMVANTEAIDGGAAIIAGNERVLRARLADAQFFWNQDRKTPLEDHAPQLEKVIFHAKLGTVADKVNRMQQLSADLAAPCGADVGDAQRAALLCKADLTTEMVGEFPGLQGVMGRYYALAQGEKAEVAQAIADHYSPAGPNDACPTAPLSVAVALADKIDTLVGFFAIDEKPTGSKDPYALRRAALGVIRLIIENNLRVALLDIFAAAYLNYLRVFANRYCLFEPDGEGEPVYQVIATSAHDLNYNQRCQYYVLFGQMRDSYIDDEIFVVGGDEVPIPIPKARDLNNDLLAFFADRLKVHLKEKGVRHDYIAAVFALGEDDLVRLLARVDALENFLNTDDGSNLLVAYRRAANIVRIEEKKDHRSYGGEPDTSRLQEDEEKALAAALADVAAGSDPAIKGEDFEEAMGALAHLRGPVDAFFDHVTVNCDDAELRENRLILLSQIRSAMDHVADFSKIEGGET